MIPDEEVPYRIPATAPVPDTVTFKDEAELSTLQNVKKILRQEIINLYKDFNAFSLAEKATDEEISNTLMRIILGKQFAYDILVPIESMIISAIEAVEQKK